MKIAIVTWIKHYNYGTYLQAYALSHAINNLNHDACILNDNNIKPFFAEKKAKLTLDKLIVKCLKYPFNGKVRKQYALERQKEIEKYQLYETFKQKHLNIENNLDQNYLNQTYDIFIAGSDQIWSPLDKNYSPYYYLDFVNDNYKKNSYAPSIGINEINDKYKDILKKHLDTFNHISTREEQGKNLLKNVTNKNIEVVLDPTFLLSKEHYTKIASKRLIKENYLFCYFLGDKPWYRKYAENMAKKKKLKLVVLSTKEIDNNKYLYKKNTGPSEFLSLIKYSSYVITDSFHGTIFSLIFNKEFTSVKRFDDNEKLDQNSRIYNLLSKLNLENRFIEKDTTLSKINYDKVNKLLSKEIDKSLIYLQSIVGDTNANN